MSLVSCCCSGMEHMSWNTNAGTNTNVNTYNTKKKHFSFIHATCFCHPSFLALEARRRIQSGKRGVILYLNLILYLYVYQSGKIRVLSRILYIFCICIYIQDILFEKCCFCLNLFGVLLRICDIYREGFLCSNVLVKLSLQSEENHVLVKNFRKFVIFRKCFFVLF